MIVKSLVVGLLGTNCFIVGCDGGGSGMVIDPGGDVSYITEAIDRLGLKIEYIVNTHGHSDHILGNDVIREVTGARVVIHEDDADMLGDPQRNLSYFTGAFVEASPADILVREGDVLRCGRLSFRVLHTPGHTPGSITLVGEGAAFTGDTLFAGSVGRTDLPGASYPDLIRSLREKLMALDESTVVYPGHGPQTTIGDEARTNPFVA
ncbi:MAG: MBL fold metallo-hydrolase [bacterium]